MSQDQPTAADQKTLTKYEKLRLRRKKKKSNTKNQGAESSTPQARDTAYAVQHIINLTKKSLAEYYWRCGRPAQIENCSLLKRLLEKQPPQHLADPERIAASIYQCTYASSYSQAFINFFAPNALYQVDVEMLAKELEANGLAPAKFEKAA